MKKEKERKLTAAELRRKESFDKLKQKMESDGYTFHDLTIGTVQANVAAVFIMLPFALGFILWYLGVNQSMRIEFSIPEMGLFLILLMALVVGHELLHGLLWGTFSQSGFKAVEFGVIWSMLTPYCTCSEPLKKWQYFLGAVFPTLLLGFGLDIIAIYTNAVLLHFLALIMIFGGGGDFCIILKLLRHQAKGNAVYVDHPYQCGLVVFERN